MDICLENLLGDIRDKGLNAGDKNTTSKIRDLEATDFQTCSDENENAHKDTHH